MYSSCPSPVANLITATISNAPAMRYIGWKRVYDTITTAPAAGRTPTSLVELLRGAIIEEETVWGHMESLEESMTVNTLRRLRAGELAFRVRDLMGLETMSEDPADTISATYPEMADIYLKPMMGLLQRIANAGDEPMTVTQQRVRIFEDLWKSLTRNLKEGKLASLMREHLDRLEGSPLPPKREELPNSNETQRHNESGTIDLTGE